MLHKGLNPTDERTKSTFGFSQATAVREPLAGVWPPLRAMHAQLSAISQSARVLPLCSRGCHVTAQEQKLPDMPEGCKPVDPFWKIIQCVSPPSCPRCLACCTWFIGLAAATCALLGWRSIPATEY